MLFSVLEKLQCRPFFDTNIQYLTHIHNERNFDSTFFIKQCLIHFFLGLNIANGMLSMHKVVIVWPAFFLDGVKFYC